MPNEPEWIVEALGRKNAGEYGYRTSDWCVKEKGSMPGEILCVVPNGVTDVEDPKTGSLELAKRICNLPRLEELARQLTLCLDEGDDNGNSTHYALNASGEFGIRVYAKGSFIALVEEARKLVGA